MPLFDAFQCSFGFDIQKYNKMRVLPTINFNNNELHELGHGLKQC